LMALLTTKDHREIPPLSLDTPLLVNHQNEGNQYQVVGEDVLGDQQQQRRRVSDKLPPTIVTGALCKNQKAFKARLAALLRSDWLLALLGVLSFVVFGIITNSDNLSLPLWAWIGLQAYQLALALALTTLLG
ncbi:hypothetical protein FOZ62_014930, partial [Perkinsus olseni]